MHHRLASIVLLAVVTLASCSKSNSAPQDAGPICAVGAQACSTASDCPAPAEACFAATCQGGCCVTAPAPAETACTATDGHVCDGQGHCVACVAASDCGASPAACTALTCSNNVCGTAPADEGTHCAEDGGSFCNDHGTCVQCLKTQDCPGSSAPSCSRGMLTSAAVCGSDGTCQASTTPCPGGFTCVSETACGTSCALDAECASPRDYCSLGTCVLKPISAKCVAESVLAASDVLTDLPMNSGTLSNGVTFTTCPNGSTSAASPPVCITETGLYQLQPASTTTRDSISLSGTLLVLARDIPVMLNVGACAPVVQCSVDWSGYVPGSNSVMVPVDIAITVNAAQGNSLLVTHVIDEMTAKVKLMDYVYREAPPACDALCCIQDSCRCTAANTQITSEIKDSIASSIMSTLPDTLLSMVEGQLCATMNSSVDGVCVEGTIPDAKDICRYPDGSCPPQEPIAEGSCNFAP